MRVASFLSLLPILTGCYTYTRAPGAIGKVFDADTGKPVLGALVTRPTTNSLMGTVPSATVTTDKHGAFNLPPDLETQAGWHLHLRNPEMVSSSFVIAAQGYATNELRGDATARSFWRADLGKILMRQEK